jgi:thiol:disulfide interchange protein
MTFGPIFGALYFLLCAWMGLQFLGSSELSTQAGGLMLAVFGISLAYGLLSRRNWARAGGIGAAVALAGFAWWLINTRGTSIDFLLLMSSFAAIVLLGIPATAPRRRDPGETPTGATSGRLVALAASLSAVGLIGTSLWAYSGDREAKPSNPTIIGLDLPSRVAWTDYGAGLSRARTEDKPMLVSFVADWCGYCKKMDRETWTHPSVVERASALVAVEVDVDDTREINGFTGAELAARYRISGTPMTMLIDGDGQVMAQTGGFLTPRQLLPWLEESLSSSAR